MLWLICLSVDIISGLRQDLAPNPAGALCFFGAVAVAFLAGAVYGHEAEYEKAQRRKKLEEDPMAQPLLGSEKRQRNSSPGEIC
ncbi:hypothetical protein V493_06753 [Pseudogymnoascus sp. VKM F-4281 (FW-2241)]|nr:hypothetical protein V493_06753 [Pseudogymnoascus sp. VKM F-4281 (FW-2241)]